MPLTSLTSVLTLCTTLFRGRRLGCH